MPSNKDAPTPLPNATASKADVKKFEKTLSPWQPPLKGGIDDPRKKTDKSFKLADCDPAAKPFSRGDKQCDKAAVETLAL